jgi:hypothetical protein
MRRPSGSIPKIGFSIGMVRGSLPGAIGIRGSVCHCGADDFCYSTAKLIRS